MSFIDKGNFKDYWTEAQDHQRQYTQSFVEYERLARNKVSAKIANELPKVTDGTLAAIIQEQPKRVVQQIPSGLVVCKQYPELAEVAGYELTEKIFPLMKNQGSLLMKSWNMIGKALTYGMQISYTYFTQTGDQMHTDFSLPYIRDYFPEKGKVFAPDSNVEILRGWYTKSDIQAIISKEERLIKKDKSYKTTWNLKALKKFKDTNVQTTKDQPTPAETEKGSPQGGLEMLHFFQKGIGEKFYTYIPAIDMIAREWTNPDPRGLSPINHLYANVDLSNPYGRGAVEMSGGVQNLIDHQMVMFQFLQTLQMGPPLQVWGNVNKTTLKFKPNAIWDMGTSQNNRVDPYVVSNTAVNNFPQNYGLLKSQILNLNSSIDNSVSAESGNPGFSKTPAGVEANNARLSISDNYMRKQYEEWFSDMCETSLNIYFPKMEGEGELELPKEQLQKMAPDTINKYYDEKKNIVKVPYKVVKDDVMKFQVDPASSEVKERSDNAEKLTELLRISQNILDPTQKYLITRKIGEAIGVQGIDDIFPPLRSVQGQNQLQTAEAMLGTPGSQPAVPGEQVPNSPSNEQAPPPGVAAGVPQPSQDSLSTEERELVEQMLLQGIPEEEVEQKILAMRQGVV